MESQNIIFVPLNTTNYRDKYALKLVQMLFLRSHQWWNGHDSYTFSEG